MDEAAITLMTMKHSMNQYSLLAARNRLCYAFKKVLHQERGRLEAAEAELRRLRDLKELAAKLRARKDQRDLRLQDELAISRAENERLRGALLKFGAFRGDFPADAVTDAASCSVSVCGWIETASESLS